MTRLERHAALNLITDCYVRLGLFSPADVEALREEVRTLWQADAGVCEAYLVGESAQCRRYLGELTGAPA